VNKASSQIGRAAPILLDNWDGVILPALSRLEKEGWKSLIGRHGRPMRLLPTAPRTDPMSRTRQIVPHHGGLRNCDVAMVPQLHNWMPTAPIGYSGALEQMRALVAEIRRKPIAKSHLTLFQL
jgi:hypothetical protein